MKFFQKPLLLSIIVLAQIFGITQLHAQETRFDSSLVLLNKSIVNNKFDTLSYLKATDLLRDIPLTTAQLEKVETISKQFDSWDSDIWPFILKLIVFDAYINTNFEKAILYGQSQIAQLDTYDIRNSRKLRTSTTDILYRSSDGLDLKPIFLTQLRLPYRNSDKLEQGLLYFSQKLNEYKVRNDSLSLYACYYVLGGFYDISGLSDLAIYHSKSALSYLDSVKNHTTWTTNLGILGMYYIKNENIIEGQKYLLKSYREHQKKNPLSGFASLLHAAVKTQLNQLDSADYYIKVSKDYFYQNGPVWIVPYLQTQALYYIETGDLDKAESNLIECQQLIKDNNIIVNPASGLLAPDYYLALARIKQNRLNDAIDLLYKDIKRLKNNRKEILRDLKLLAELYRKTGNPNMAAEVYARYIDMKNTLIAEQNKFRSISFETEQQMNENQLAIEKLESQNQLASTTRNFTIGIAVLLLLLLGGIYLRFQAKKKANEVLTRTLEDLKATQIQLIHAEKMASLGELTAGIAHEIQNPLNFVNNFSELNNEMLEELIEEVENGDLEEAKAIAKDIIANERKIKHHGKRADEIVKGMLAHSRTGSGEKVPTDLNKLADEYLRLSYHGLRAKDKSFNADFKTDFDSALPLINVIPQDIGRVLLNLINNAFQAAAEVEKPMVQVATRKTEKGIEIAVSDNGPGIPDSIKDKIFQPFFTTKPTGQGTGLGLSLSYDIVKAHGGTLNVQSSKNGGTIFTVELHV